MKRTPVESSNIVNLGYDKENQILEVEFKHGGVYHYKDVPINTVNALLKADSLGSFFAKEIKTRFDFEKGEFKEVVVPNIYFCGGAGAGKTYCAKYLMDKLGYIQAKMAFPVYSLATNYFGMTSKDRNLLQIIGTDSGRSVVDRNIWVNRFVEDTKIVEVTREKLGLPKVGFVSDDIRFENEKIALDKAGWVGIYLKVSEEIRIKRLQKRDGDAQVSTLKHSSEIDIDKFKDELIPINASGTLEETYTQLDEVLAAIKGVQVNG